MQQKYNISNIENTISYGAVILCACFCALGVVTGTGIGEMLHAYTIAEFAVLALAIMTYSGMSIPLPGKHTSVIIFFLVAINAYYMVRFGNNMFGYLWMYLLVYVISQFDISSRTMRMIGFIYGAEALVMLLASQYTSLVAGWDGNMISMVAFYGFIIFTVNHSELKQQKGIFIFLVYCAIYFYYLWKLDCRSVIIASVILILAVFSIINLKKVCKNGKFLLFLLIPTLCVFFIPTLLSTKIGIYIEGLSYDIFGKPLLNGREEIWIRGINTLKNTPIFGNGNLNYGAYHSSSLMCLVGGGVIGLLIWIYTLKNYLTYASFFADDNIVMGLMVGVLCIWIQQSFDMGIIGNTDINCGFYVILGLMLARSNTIRKYGLLNLSVK